MSRNLLKSVVAAGMLAVGPMALADDHVFHPYYFGATVGYDFLDSGRRADDDILYGLNIGWFMAPKFSIDLQWDRVETNIDAAVVDAWIPGATYTDLSLNALTIMGRYYLGEVDNFMPYLGVGIGYAEHSSIFHTGWDPTLNLGFGFLGNMSDRWSYRLEGLYRRDNDSDTFSDNTREIRLDEDGFDDFIVSFNLFYRWGGKPAPVVAAAPVDSDGDGVPDDQDRCPNTPAGVQVDQYGCPLDSDGDGVPDYRDKCPGTPAGAIVDRDGCEVQAVIELDNVYFEFDSAKLKPESIDRLDQAVELLTVHEKVVIEIAGHTDSTGPEDYNQGLSERRANSVMEYFADQGINASRMSARGYGETKPIASNDTREGRAENRRVEMIVLER